MELRSIDGILTSAEKYELVKRTLKEKQEEIRKVEHQMDEFLTEDAELEYLSGFLGAEYINPGGKNNANEVTPLQQQREYLAYVITKLENKQAELEGVPQEGDDAQQKASGPPPASDTGGNMWNSP